SEYLMALGRQLHPTVWITGLTVVGDGTEITITGRTVQPQTLPQYLQRLAQEERYAGRRFAQVDIGIVPPDEHVVDGAVQFTLRTQPAGTDTKARTGEDAAREIANKSKEAGK